MDGHAAMSKVKHEDSMMCAYFSASIKVIVACAMSTKSPQHAHRELVAVRSKEAEKMNMTASAETEYEIKGSKDRAYSV
jgi:hypothetical protein